MGVPTPQCLKTQPSIISFPSYQRSAWGSVDSVYSWRTRLLCRVPHPTTHNDKRKATAYKQSAESLRRRKLIVDHELLTYHSIDQ